MTNLGNDMVNFITEKLEIPAEQHNVVAVHRSHQMKPTHSGTTPFSIVVKFLSWDTHQKNLDAHL